MGKIIFRTIDPWGYCSVCKEPTVKFNSRRDPHGKLVCAVCVAINYQEKEKYEYR